MAKVISRPLKEDDPEAQQTLILFGPVLKHFMRKPTDAADRGTDQGRDAGAPQGPEDREPGK